MIVYKAGFGVLKKTVLARGLDFPGAITERKDLEDARKRVADALVTMAESYFKDGPSLPVPNSKSSDPEADLEEPIYLLTNATHAVKMFPKV